MRMRKARSIPHAVCSARREFNRAGSWQRAELRLVENAIVESRKRHLCNGVFKPFGTILRSPSF